MKKKIYGILLILFVFPNYNSQIHSSSDSLALQRNFSKKIKNDLFINLNYGVDFPMVNNNLHYVGFGSGNNVGLSLSYYWNVIGLGADVDYIRNSVKNLYPASDLTIDGGLVRQIEVHNDNVKRFFYGVGPSIKLDNFSKKIMVEVFSRVGLASIKGGVINARIVENNVLLNAYNGYNQNNLLSLKAGGKVYYNITDNLSINIGGYYLRHLNAADESNGEFTAYYRNLAGKDIQNSYSVRSTSCNCDYQSFGVTAGVNFRFDVGRKLDTSEKFYNKNTVTVKVIDQVSLTKMPYTKVDLVNSDNDIIKTGTTNHDGIVVFENVTPDTYTVKGKFYSKDLEDISIAKNEFNSKRAKIQKTIYYDNKGVLLVGKITDCNTNKPLSYANVFAETNTKKGNKAAITDAEGNFMLQLDNDATYKVRASKSLYFSDVKTIVTNSDIRKSSIYLDVEICAENAEVGNSIKLNKIYYDFDKATFRIEAYQELDKLLQFLNDNSGAKVELTSHTDSRGSDDYNMKLSNARAKSVVDYLVRNGVERSRLEAKGMGESKILNRCFDEVPCSDQEHLQNRRTEMKVISNK